MIAKMKAETGMGMKMYKREARLGFRAWGLGLRVYGLGCRVWKRPSPTCRAHVFSIYRILK